MAENEARGTACFMVISQKSIIIGIMLKAPDMPAMFETPISMKMTAEPMISRFTFRGSVKGTNPYDITRLLTKEKPFENRAVAPAFAMQR